LLNQEAGTLIIDQPEDDLDNRVIMVIVKLLQTTKRRRQLIFATRNPNFVVNGDADKVVGLTPNVEPGAPDAVQAAQIEIDTDGAIETPSVRSAITETMEGGREAFELRSRKYAFESEIPIGSAVVEKRASPTR
jgi:chromosome segregation protein